MKKETVFRFAIYYQLKSGEKKSKKIRSPDLKFGLVKGRNRTQKCLGTVLLLMFFRNSLAEKA